MLLLDCSKAGRPIIVVRRQIGLIGEQGQIVVNTNMKYITKEKKGKPYYFCILVTKLST